ncbi:hypothetical protein GCM10027290_04500 [Micromonospora sonneratiae]
MHLDAAFDRDDMDRWQADAGVKAATTYRARRLGRWPSPPKLPVGAWREGCHRWAVPSAAVYDTDQPIGSSDQFDDPPAAAAGVGGAGYPGSACGPQARG